MKFIPSTQLRNSLEQAIPITISNQFGQFGNLEVPMSNTIIELSDDHTDQAEALIMAGLQNLNAFVTEETAATRIIGLPSLIARLDCTVDQKGNVQSYEVEERPSGLGLIHAITQTITGTSFVKSTLIDHFLDVLDGELPTVLISERRSYGTDDHTILPTRTLGQVEAGGFVLIRAEPSEINQGLQAVLAPRSISTVLDKGQKMGRVTEDGIRVVTKPCDLPDSTCSFVIKPAQGSKARGVHVYLNAADRIRFGTNGTRTHTRIGKEVTQLVAAGQMVLCEPFLAPIRVDLNDGELANMMLRLLAVVKRDRCKIIGGAFVVRKNNIIHGSADAFNGPIKVR